MTRCRAKETDRNNASGGICKGLEVAEYCSAYTTRGNTRADALATSLYTAALVENMFMDNVEDAAFLLSPEGQQSLINLHVDGICTYLANC